MCQDWACIPSHEAGWDCSGSSRPMIRPIMLVVESRNSRPVRVASRVRQQPAVGPTDRQHSNVVVTDRDPVALDSMLPKAQKTASH